MSILTSLPRPTLPLLFAREKFRTDLLTFSRTTTKTRVNRFGLIESVPIDTSALEYDPVTGECLGRRIEASRTNLLLRSEEFNNAYWLPNTGVSINSNQGSSPAGTLTMDAIVESSGTTVQQRISQSGGVYTTVIGNPYTVHVFVRKGSRRYFNISMTNTGAASSSFDLDTGLVIGFSGPGVVASISIIGNGLFRCSVTKTPTAAGNSVIYIGSANTASIPAVGTTESYLGNGSESCYIWGAQLETGSFPTSYIPTVASTVIRAADILGTTNVTWLNQGRGTFTAKALRMNSGQIAPLFRIKNAGDTSYIEVYRDASNIVHGLIVNGGVTQADVQITDASTNINVALAYENNNVRMSVNGVTVVSDVSATIPTDFNELLIGRNGTNWLNANMAELVYMPQPITSPNLQIYSR